MNFNQAIEYSLTVPWKTVECFAGPNCWCRMVVPVNPIPCDYVNSDGTIMKDTLDTIIGPATIDEKTAQHIVDLHNNSLVNEHPLLS